MAAKWSCVQLVICLFLFRLFHSDSIYCETFDETESLTAWTITNGDGSEIPGRSIFRFGQAQNAQLSNIASISTVGYNNVSLSFEYNCKHTNDESFFEALDVYYSCGLYKIEPQFLSNYQVNGADSQNTWYNVNDPLPQICENDEFGIDLRFEQLNNTQNDLQCRLDNICIEGTEIQIKPGGATEPPPTVVPTFMPTDYPTEYPTLFPSYQPSTRSPTNEPTLFSTLSFTSPLPTLHIQHEQGVAETTHPNATEVTDALNTLSGIDSIEKNASTITDMMFIIAVISCSLLVSFIICCGMYFVMSRQKRVHDETVLIKISKNEMENVPQPQNANSFSEGDDVHKVNSLQSVPDVQHQCNDIENQTVEGQSGETATNGLHVETQIVFDGEEQIEIREWLRVNCGDLICEKYFDVFILNGYQSLDFIKEIKTSADLIDIGIVLGEHQEKILEEIGKLRGILLLKS